MTTHPPIVRYSYWEECLSNYLDRIREQPFDWGSHDCALMASGAVKAMTGTDPGEAFRGTYSTREGAAEVLRTLGAGTLLKTAISWFGPAKHPSQAMRGDLVMKDRTTLGVCVGQWSWFVGEEAGQEGLISWPTARCTKAFTVPFDAPASSVEAR